MISFLFMKFLEPFSMIYLVAEIFLILDFIIFCHYIICRKLYCQNLTSSSFIDKEICIKNYPSEDYHLMYIAEITNIYENQK